MENLFVDIETKKTSKKELKIVTTKTKTLSKKQLAFNKLAKEIENATKKIEKDRLRLETLLQEHVKVIPPLEKKYADSQVRIAKSLAKSVEVFKFTATQKELLATCIIRLCDESFCIAPADEEAIALYDAWSETSYQEEKKERDEDIKQRLADDIKDELGVDFDFSDIDDTPEGLARFMQRMKEILEQKQNEEAEEFSTRKKTKKQLEKEAIQEQKDAQKLKEHP